MAACPDELWNRHSSQMGFWYMAYHALWYLDHDLSPVDVEFTSPPFDIHNYEIEFKMPPYNDPYSKSDLLGYLQHCRTSAKSAIDRLDSPDSRHVRGCERAQACALEVVVGQIRHIEHHAAQLNLLLRQTIDSAPQWVRRSN
jgi:hypothetical protein